MSHIPECDKLKEGGGAFKTDCPLCSTGFYVYFDPDDNTDKIDVIKGKCARIMVSFIHTWEIIEWDVSSTPCTQLPQPFP